MLKTILIAIGLATAVASVSYGRGGTPRQNYGILEAQLPAAWPMIAPSTGGYCALYVNGVETLGVDANSSGVCYFGYVTGLVTYTIIGYQMTNNDFVETGLTVQGEIRLTTTCNNCTHVVQLQ